MTVCPVLQATVHTARSVDTTTSIPSGSHAPLPLRTPGWSPVSPLRVCAACVCNCPSRPHPLAVCIPSPSNPEAESWQSCLSLDSTLNPCSAADAARQCQPSRIRRWTTAPAHVLVPLRPSWQAAPPQAAGGSAYHPQQHNEQQQDERLAPAAQRCRQASRGVHPTDPVRRGWRLLGRPGGLRSRHGTTAAARAAATQRTQPRRQHRARGLRARHGRCVGGAGGLRG